MIIREVEEVLEKIWTCSEQNEHRLSTIKEKSRVKITPEILDYLEKDDLIAHSNNNILLTYKGKQYASDIIRRHRLAERLLSDVLNMNLANIEPHACEFEHVIIEEVVDSICTLLGHPRECPHGIAIPEGKCCRETRNLVSNTVMSLDKLNVGENAKIAYVSTNNNHSRLHKLISFGITPGIKVRVHQKTPTYVIKCGHTELALERDVISNIFVWKDLSCLIA